MKTLKDILKPPFVSGGGHVCCEVADFGLGYRRVIDICGWGTFQNCKNGDEIQDELEAFTAAALNEKWERDFGNKEIK